MVQPLLIRARVQVLGHIPLEALLEDHLVELLAQEDSGDSVREALVQISPSTIYSKPLAVKRGEDEQVEGHLSSQNRKRY